MKRRKHLKRRKTTGKRPANRQARNKDLAPRTAKQYFAKSVEFRDKWTRVTHVISRMRTDGISLKRASREFGLSTSTVIRLAKPALRKRKGRYAAKPTDKLLRLLVIPTRKGLLEIAMRDSRQASRVGEYWAAVQKYLRTGDASAIEEFRRRGITDASRKRISLLTNLEELDRLASAGVLSFESLYAGVT